MLQHHEQLALEVCGGKAQLGAGAGRGAPGTGTGVCVGGVHTPLSPLGALGWAQLWCCHSGLQGSCAEGTVSHRWWEAEETPFIPLSFHPSMLPLEDEQHE